MIRLWFAVWWSSDCNILISLIRHIENHYFCDISITHGPHTRRQLVRIFYFPDSSIDSNIFDDSQTILIIHSYQAHNDTSGNCLLSLEVFIIHHCPFSKVIVWLTDFCGVIQINTTYQSIPCRITHLEIAHSAMVDMVIRQNYSNT